MRKLIMLGVVAVAGAVGLLPAATAVGATGPSPAVSPADRPGTGGRNRADHPGTGGTDPAGSAAVQAIERDLAGLHPRLADGRAPALHALGIHSGGGVSTRASGSGQVAVGARHTCAIVLFRHVWCWGANAAGQLGVGSTLSARHPVQTTASGPLAAAVWVVQVAAGKAYTCAVAVVDLDAAPVLFCWGDNGEGQLGDGGFSSRDRPEQVASDVVQVAAGAEHTCVLSTDGAVSCWGRNDVGQLGLGVTGGSRSVPQQVPGLADITDIAAGDDNTCAVAEDGQTWCWGADTDGQLGDGGGPSGGPAATPVLVTGAPAGGFVAIDAGRGHVCALTADGEAYCWGDDTSGQLGTAAVDHSQPGSVRGSRRYATISAGGDSSCALTLGGRPYCWGANAVGQLGVGDHTARSAPAAVDDHGIETSTLVRSLMGSPVPVYGDLEIGPGHACLVDLLGVVSCAGGNSARQLGAGGTAAAVRPAETVLAPGAARQVQVTAGDGRLDVRWSPPDDQGAAAVSGYGALAFDGSANAAISCDPGAARSCVIGGLANDRRYTVVVGAVSDAGISYSATAYGTPAASGQGAGLPITGPGLAGAWLLLGVGLAITVTLRRPRS